MTGSQRFRLAAVGGLLVLSLAAYSVFRKGSARPSGRGGASRPPGTWVQATLAGADVRLNGTLTIDAAPIGGATVECVGAPTPRSATTSANGSWSLAVPADRTVYLRASLANYHTVQSAVRFTEAGGTLLPMELAPNDRVASIYRKADLTEDPRAGGVVVWFRLPSRMTGNGAKPEGFGASLSAGGGTALVETDGEPRRGHVTTGGEEIVIFLNVAAGDTTITATAPSGFSCAPTPNVLTTVHVDPGVVTFVSFNCS